MEIKPCPRCQSDHTGVVEVRFIGEARIECHNCKLAGPYKKSSQEAIDWWNTRAPDPLVKQLKDEIYRLNTKIDEDRFAALADDSVPRVVFCAAIDTIANKDELLKEMAEALEEIVRCLSHGLQDCRASLTAKAMLQKYREQETTNAK